MPIEHISDTARWVAVYRAMETERPDAIFRDPYARRLAGERGQQIVDTMPRGRWVAWAMIVRTAVLDEVILRLVRAGHVDTVLNLAAGLDARPWRLDLPASLHWIDVDLPAILGYKLEQLAAERPHCRYEAVMLDLADVDARRALFRRVGAESRAVLVVSEGLLVYLTEEQVASLADDLHAQASFRWWLFDLSSPAVLEWMKREWRHGLASGGAEMKFAPDAGAEFFRPHGWQVAESHSSAEEARRLHREMRVPWFAKLMMKLATPRQRERFRRMTTSFILLERA